MKSRSIILSGLFLLALTLVTSCSSKKESKKEENEGTKIESTNEQHARETETAGNEEGEEQGKMLALDAHFDAVRNGVRLILDYNAQDHSFNGTVENVSEKIAEKVRVEVHLSDGTELGPTTPANMKPGEKKEVKLSTTQKDFTGWVAHAEVGSSEEGHENESQGERHEDDDDKD